MTVADSDRCCEQVDNRITQEVYQLTLSISSMTWMVLRPMFDAVYCTILLVRVRLPPIAMVTMFGYGIFGVGLIRLFSPDFKKIAQEQERLSAELRTVCRHDVAWHLGCILPRVPAVSLRAGAREGGAEQRGHRLPGRRQR